MSKDFLPVEHHSWIDAYLAFGEEWIQRPIFWLTMVPITIATLIFVGVAWVILPKNKFERLL